MEELFVRQVDIGIAEMDVAVGDQLATTRVVVQHATATDGRGGPERQLLLVYGAEETPAVAEALLHAAETAATP